MAEQEEKDTLELHTAEKENRMNLKALVEASNDLRIKYYDLKKENDNMKKQMEILNNNFAQVLQRVNIVAAQQMGRGPTG